VWAALREVCTHRTLQEVAVQQFLSLSLFILSQTKQSQYKQQRTSKRTYYMMQSSSQIHLSENHTLYALLFSQPDFTIKWNFWKVLVPSVPYTY